MYNYFIVDKMLKRSKVTLKMNILQDIIYFYFVS